MGILSFEQIDQFFEQGWLKIESAIPRELALQAQSELWNILKDKHGINYEDRTTWEYPFYQLSENYTHGVFKYCSTDRLRSAIMELVGDNRLEVDYEMDGIPFGWWPINLTLGSTQPWDVPVGGWHWDGMHFRHYINSAYQGLLMIALFSDVEPRGGGTLLAEGSHKLVARFLEGYQDGIEYKDAIPLLNRSHPWLAELTDSFGEITDADRKEIYVTDQIHSVSNSQDRISKFMLQNYVDEQGTQLRVVEALGKAGDVILCHPFLYHTGSQNHSNQPRIMCNLNTPLKEDMSLLREGDTGYSLLELSIKHALDTVRLNRK